MANNEYVNKVEFGDTTVIDISDTTAEAGDVVVGKTFYAKSGAPTTGSLSDATQSTHGLMSTTDKIKLDGISTMTGATSLVAGASGLVPAPTTSDTTKFLRGDGTWANAEIGILTYDVSTWDDFLSAYNANRLVYCKATTEESGNQYRLAHFVFKHTSTYAEFHYYMSDTAQDKLYIYKLHNTDGWSTIVRDINIPVMTGSTSSSQGATGLVPKPGISDRDKFLSGDGTYKSGGLPMVILSYGSSTWQDFINAYQNNVIVYCRASSNSNPASGSQTRMAFMAYVSDASNPSNVEFQYYRSMSSHSSTAMGDEVYVYKLTNSNGGTWSVTTRKASIKEIAVASGSKLGVSWSSDKVTLSNTMTADDMPMSSSDSTKAKAAIESLASQLTSTQTVTSSTPTNDATSGSVTLVKCGKIRQLIFEDAVVPSAGYITVTIPTEDRPKIQTLAPVYGGAGKDVLVWVRPSSSATALGWIGSSADLSIVGTLTWIIP